MGFFSKLTREISRIGRQIEKGVSRTLKDVEMLFSAPEIPEPADTSSSTGALVNKTAATDSIPVIYGRRRRGGTRVLLHTQGDKNKNLYSVLVYCEGPIAGIREIEINDDTISNWGGSASYSIADATRLSLTSDVSFCAHFGGWTQAADALFVSELGELWTTDHKLTGLAYSSTRYVYNSEKIGSLPSQTAVIDGRLLYDPRDGEASFSSNAALAILDYMRDDVYGEKVPDEEIDFDSFKVAADIADITAETFEGSGKAYRPIDINAVIDTNVSRLDNIKSLLAHAHASLPFSGGKYRLVIRSATEPSFDFNDDNISGDISIGSAGASDKYNRVTVTFIDPELNWEENTVVYPTDDDEYQQLLSDDNGIEKEGEVTANMITNKYQALDYARRYLYESRKALAIGFSALPAARGVLPGQVVSVTTASLGSFLFTVEKRVVTADGEYKFTLKEYDPSLYSWINTADLSTGATPSMPSAFNLPAPQNIAFTPVAYNPDYQGVLSWDESDSAFVTRYRVEIYNTVTGMLAWSNQIANNSVQIPNFPAGNYRADVKGLSEISATPTASISWTYSVPVLPIVTGLQQYGEFDTDLTLRWNAVSERAALRMYQVDLLLDDLVIYSVNTSTESITINLAQFEALGFPRVFNVNVSAVNIALSNGPAASVTIQKPAPLPPLSVSFSPSVSSFVTRLVKATNAKGVTAWLSTESPVDETAENQIYSGDLARFEIGDLSPLTKYYVRIASYDAFGLGTSSAHSVTTLRDAVADSIQQLTERDLSLTEDLEAIAQAAANQAHKQQVNTDAVAEQLFNSAARAAEVERVQANQNDEYYRILNAVVEIDPSTGTITNRAYEYTNGKFSEAALLIDGVNASINLQATRIETAEGRLTDAESELSVQAGLINQRATYTQLTETVANAIAAIQPAYVTTFNTGLDGWSAVNGTIAYNAGAWLDTTLGDVSSSMDFDGAENPVIQIAIARAAGAAWIGKIQYKTASHGYSSAHEMDINDIPDDGQQYTVSVDFGAATDYTASTITGIRIILGATTADAYQVHSVQAGKRTAAQAAIEGLQGRVSVAEQNIDAVNGQLSNYVTTTFYEQNTLTQNDVQQTLDSWDAQYSIVAKLTQLDENGTIAKANSAEQWIDGAEALISQIAQTTTQNEYGARMSNVEQTLDAQAGTISQQIISTHKLQVADDALSENAFLEAAKSAAAAREQTAQSDTIALARSETKAVAGETTALAQMVDELAVQVGDNKAEFTDYRRTAIGYCVDANGNPTSHETAVSCELAGNTWMGESSIAEALRNVTVTGTNAAGEAVEVSAGAMYQAILDADGQATATAAVMAIYGNQLAGIFANAGEDGSSLEFIANAMKFKTENGTKTPFSIAGDVVELSNARITSELNVNNKAIIDANGSAYFEDASVRGHIEAESGSFKGHIEAESGSFKGHIEAESGSFKGHIEATSGSIKNLTASNVIIDESCTVKGTITADRVIGSKVLIATGQFGVGNIGDMGGSTFTVKASGYVDTNYAISGWGGSSSTYIVELSGGGGNGGGFSRYTHIAAEDSWFSVCVDNVMEVTPWAVKPATIFFKYSVWTRYARTESGATMTWRLYELK